MPCRIVLRNERGDRLTVFYSGDHSTYVENALRDVAERAINRDPDHAKYGPWTAVYSSWGG